MIDELVIDEIKLITEKNRYFTKAIKKKQIHYFIFCNYSGVAQYFLLTLIKYTYNKNIHITIICDNNNSRTIFQDLGENDITSQKISYVSQENFLKNEHLEGSYEKFILYFSDFEKELFKDNLKKINEVDGVTRIILFYQYSIKCFPNFEDKKIAENELIPLSYKYKQTNSTSNRLEMETYILSLSETYNFSLITIRSSPVYGPLINHKEESLINRCLKGVVENKIITIKSRDRETIVNPIYIRDAISGIYKILTYGHPGEIYHISGTPVSLFTIKSNIYQLFGEKFPVILSSDENSDSSELLLSSKKITTLGWKPYVTMMRGLKRVLASETDFDWNKEVNRYYDGKLKLIQHAEIKLLQEIDRICKKHTIQYFLTFGSALGAYRHKGFIPWDDDLDIGMLRSDLEKFRKIIVSELPEEYIYQSKYFDKSCPYIFDKVRIKNTICSTNYSSNHSKEQGIFLDIFVYDYTSNNKYSQKLHIFLVRNLIRIRKLKKKYKNIKKYKSFKLFLKKIIITSIPLVLSELLLNYAILFYKNKLNAKYVIDSLSIYLNKGVFLKDMFTNLESLTFNNLTVPVPGNIEKYLITLYGKDFCVFPTISSRLRGHNIRNLDLGNKVTEYLDQ